MPLYNWFEHYNFDARQAELDKKSEQINTGYWPVATRGLSHPLPVTPSNKVQKDKKKVDKLGNTLTPLGGS